MLEDQFNVLEEPSAPHHIVNLFKDHAILGKVHKGRELITQSDAADNVYYIISGKVEISSMGLNAKEYIFREMGAGSIIGELAAIDGKKRSVTVTALSEVRYYIISGAKLLNFALENPKYSHWMMKFLTQRIRKLSLQLYESSSLNVRSRILIDLIRKATSGNNGNDSAVIAWPKDHKRSAIKLGTHREAISREYSFLIKENLIQRQGTKLIIPSLNNLNRLLNQLMGI